jgi:hypothetical protein
MRAGVGIMSRSLRGDVISPDLRMILRVLSMPNEGSREIQLHIASHTLDALLRSLASAHRIAPLLALRLEKACPAWYASDKASWLREEARKSRVVAGLLACECGRLIEAFQGAGIHTTAYKGVALSALLYQDAGTRVSGDIDLIVCKNRVAAASQCLCSLGYHPIEALDERGLLERMWENQAWVFRRRSGWPVVDLHWRIARSRIAMLGDSELWLQRCQTVQLANEEVSTLSLEAYLVALCLHGTRHSWRQLRWVCDIGQILTDGRLDAASAVCLADQMGLRRILAVGISQAQSLLEVGVAGPLADCIDRRAVRIAAQMREDMFTSDKPRWGPLLSVVTWFWLRERWRDRLASAVCLFRHILRPSLQDYAVFPLPDSLSFMYYAIRPFRLANKHARQILRGKPPSLD